MYTASDIRKLFLDYFARHNHAIIKSASLVPRNDPSLMFTAAGMVPFKNVFTGAEKRDYVRAASSQKCVRAGGKHNDLENVGYTARHHTFFEMLGNFSFGDYFKEEAIELAWKFITQELKIPENRLLVTVYSEDTEAAKLWKKISGLREERIIPISTLDNFWSMGDTGPCGPCSEIFYDHGDEIPGGPPGSSNQDGDRFVEIWNLVFMQYEQLIAGDNSKADRINLPKPSVDTGMGLERLTAVMQGVHDNYDIDIFTALIHASEEASGVSSAGSNKVSHRVIADHLRSAGFLVADGVMPSNEGRGYVLRRIMRRAMRHVHMLGCKQPMMGRLVSTLVAKMGDAYPELNHAESLITEVLTLEEERFKQTLERGLKLLEEETRQLPEGALLPGETAFKLYDTYGFPLDLTQDILKGKQQGVDIIGFEKAMARQKAEARASWAGSGDKCEERVWFEIYQRCGATEFLGYDETGAESYIVGLVCEGVEVPVATEGESVFIVTNQTPFYAESGGQMGDTGTFKSFEGAEVEIKDTIKKIGELHVHRGKVIKGKIASGDVVKMAIDTERRTALRANHSATHLLHAVLRKRLGPHVIQKGSLVAPDKLRFDFSHPRALSRNDIKVIEADINQSIRSNSEVITKITTPEKAQEEGAMALFGEKYNQEVRVVAMGSSLSSLEPISLELCGGTHVYRTGDIGYFKIINEAAIAAGVRRIEALTGKPAEDYAFQLEQSLFEEANLLNVPAENVLQRVQALVEENKKLKHALKELKNNGLSRENSENIFTKDLAGIKFIFRSLQNVEARELRPLADRLKKEISSGIFMILTTVDNKISFVIGVTSDLVSRYDAVKLAQVAGQVLGGKGGGGRPDLAQGGGADPARIAAAVEEVQKAILEEL